MLTSGVIAVPGTWMQRMLAGAAALITLTACAAAPVGPTSRPPGAEPGHLEPVRGTGLALAIGDDGRHLVDAVGEPFFWLGDTAWSLANTLDRGEVTDYLDARAAQGYTVIQTVALFPQGGGGDTANRYGDLPYRGTLDLPVVTEGADPDDDEQYDFWDHLDFVVAQAEARELRVALFPVWADTQVGTLVTEENAAAYGEFVGSRYGSEVVWVLGGDEGADGDEEVWRELARGIAIGATGREDYSTTLMTYHPLGDLSSAQWFHDDAWLDLDMVQGGHCLRYAVRQQVIDTTYARTPAKPVLDGEPIYADHPYCWERPPDGYSTELDVRRDAYWAVFAGAAGHTYGHHAVWQFLDGSRAPRLGGRGDWRGALDEPAGGQMRHLRALMESRTWWAAEPDQDVLAPGAGVGPARRQAIRDLDGAHVMVYSPDGAAFDVDLSALAGDVARVWWFDPRTGDASDLGVRPAEKSRFTPPSRDDWVLVADDAARGLPAPGRGFAA